MQSIKKSECPKELEPADRRSSVNVNLIRRNENYPVSFMFVFFSLSLSNLLRNQDEFSWILLLVLELLKFCIVKCNPGLLFMNDYLCLESCMSTV